MSIARWLALGFLALYACGEDDTTPPALEMEGAGGSDMRPESTREGPEGCYIEAQRRCDCAIEQAACTQAGQIWTMGCMTCQM